MHKTLSEANQFILDVKDRLPQQDKVDAVVCAPALFLPSLVDLSKDSKLAIGAQTMHFEESGAFTGEISPKALEDIAVSYVIIGHSERREMFQETDESVNKKTLAAFLYHLKPIVCVGETLQQREADETKNVVVNQVQQALQGLTEEQVKQTVIAYEPIWAIGTGKSSTAADANEVCGYIRQVIAEQFTLDAAAAVRIQYGGSVKPANIKEYLAEEHIDGALVGGASLEAESFLQLLEAGANE